MQAQYSRSTSSSSVSMARESVWKRTKAYFRRMRGKKVGGWIALLLLLMFGEECSAYSSSDVLLPNYIIQSSYQSEIERHVIAWKLPVNGIGDKIIEIFYGSSNVMDYIDADGAALLMTTETNIAPKAHKQINIMANFDSREVRRHWIEGDNGRLVTESPPKWIDAKDFTAIIFTTGIASLG
ncbi:uncharacterized protein LOC107048780 isoform X2 [Diachasma alloeum]|uniref:uncharacterized protein LOC107048780 isoform X2 n=1 Tax=Diachasma alloeum TaxID=454923 RepID=UPI0007382D72|nr:uncharacterized protein LOC107048780 isoform X2 [Diachasma alloeum]